MDENKEKEEIVIIQLLCGFVGGLIVFIYQSSYGWVGWDFSRVLGVLLIGVCPGFGFGPSIIKELVKLFRP
jgi:hypothetical protein